MVCTEELKKSEAMESITGPEYRRLTTVLAADHTSPEMMCIF